MERYSDYFVKGQGQGTDERTVRETTHPKGDARDTVIKRYRPLTVLAEGAAVHGTCVSRAKWESQLRAGASRVYEYTVAGWGQATGIPWQVNTLVDVKDTVFDLKQELLIGGIIYALNNAEGEIATLQLCHKEKYTADAELAKIAGNSEAA